MPKEDPYFLRKLEIVHGEKLFYMIRGLNLFLAFFPLNPDAKICS